MTITLFPVFGKSPQHKNSTAVRLEKLQENSPKMEVIACNDHGFYWFLVLKSIAVRTEDWSAEKDWKAPKWEPFSGSRSFSFPPNHTEYS